MNPTNKFCFSHDLGLYASFVVLEKTLKSPLDCKKIQPVHPKGNQVNFELLSVAILENHHLLSVEDL